GSAAVASRSASRVAPIRRSSSWAGMMTESIAGAGKVDTRVWPSTRAGQVNRAAQTAISSAATTLCQRQALDRIDSRPVCTGAQPSLRRARSLAVSPAALQGPEAPGPAEPGHVPYYACGACLQVPRDFLFSGRTAWPGLLVELPSQLLRPAGMREHILLRLLPIILLFTGLG